MRMDDMSIYKKLHKLSHRGEVFGDFYHLTIFNAGMNHVERLEIKYTDLDSIAPVPRYAILPNPSSDFYNSQSMEGIRDFLTRVVRDIDLKEALR